MLRSYQNALADIVRYTEAGTQFERSAILEVSADYGESPEAVTREVKSLREAKRPGEAMAKAFAEHVPSLPFAYVVQGVATLAEDDIDLFLYAMTHVLGLAANEAREHGREEEALQLNACGQALTHIAFGREMEARK